MSRPTRLTQDGIRGIKSRVLQNVAETITLHSRLADDQQGNFTEYQVPNCRVKEPTEEDLELTGMIPASSAWVVVQIWAQDMLNSTPAGMPEPKGSDKITLADGSVWYILLILRKQRRECRNCIAYKEVG